MRSSALAAAASAAVLLAPCVGVAAQAAAPVHRRRAREDHMASVAALPGLMLTPSGLAY